MSTDVRKTWRGTPPTECQLCQDPITTQFSDTKTRFGPWAIVCPTCQTKHGSGNGVGRGQTYEKQGDEWVKTAG